jgi:transposase
MSLLIRDFLAKHETTVLPQPPYSPDLAQKTRTKISIGRGDKGTFTGGPTHNPKIGLPGLLPEVEKTLGAVYQQPRGVL